MALHPPLLLLVSILLLSIIGVLKHVLLGVLLILNTHTHTNLKDMTHNCWQWITSQKCRKCLYVKLDWRGVECGAPTNVCPSEAANAALSL